MRYCVLIAMLSLTQLLHAAEKPTSIAFQGVVTLIDDVHVPAKERGVLVELKQRKGARVEQNAPIGVVDDSQATLMHELAEVEHDAAVARASNDSAIRLAEASLKTAQLEQRLNINANSSVPGTRSTVDLQRLELAVQQASLQYEHAAHEAKVALLEARMASVRSRVTAHAVQQRTIVSPLKGEIVEIFVQAGEWVEPGDPIVRIVGLDRLRVEGFIPVTAIPASGLTNMKATLRVESVGLESHEAEILHINPIVQTGGECKVSLECANIRRHDQWLLRPGMDVEVSLVLVLDGAHASP